ncbi:MAG: ATP-dependent carboxylate-amine ligase [Chloroflexi bacterium]|nr:ATP-dependent carboxylate-amine ligase [Chloroflexota bacterium]
MVNTVLILTNEDDPDADIMTQLLIRRGVNVVRFDPGDFPQGSTISMRGNEFRWQYILSAQEHVVDLQQVSSVWLRRPTKWQPPESYELGIGNFIGAERNHAIEGLWEILPALWVNHPTLDRLAGLKPYQLQIASRLGFVIPRTLITNDPSEVRDFYNECGGNTIYKPLSASDFVHLGRLIYTSPVSLSHLERVNQVSAAPCLFQEYIPKSFEVRTTVVGKRIFSAAIYSQQFENTKHDWRRETDLSLKYEPYCLPSDIESKILELTSELNLAYGAIDFVVTPSNEHVFLEINPGGQFGFVEQRTGLPIFAALADFLSSGGAE